MSTVTPIASAAEKRAEIRRKSTLSNMAASLHQMIIDVDAISKFDDSESAKRLELFRGKLAILDMRSGTLLRELQELANATNQQEVEGS